ncbi:hypothetical protein Tco_0935708 [Tanacetum coccineum]
MALGLSWCPRSTNLDLQNSRPMVELGIAKVDDSPCGGCGVRDCEGFGWVWGGQRGVKMTGGGVLRLGGKSLEEMYSSLNFGVKVWAFDRFGPPRL